MNQLSVIICDRDNSYAKNLAEYLMEKGNQSEVIAYEMQPEEVLSKSCDLYLLDAEWVAAELESLNNAKKSQVICLAGDTIAESLEVFPRVYKYQSADKIIQELYDFLSKTEARGNIRMRERGCVIGLMSPWYDGVSLLCGIALAKSLKEKGSVLYMNSRGYHGFPLSEEGDERSDLSDVLLALRMQADNPGAKIMSGIVAAGDFSYMVPVRQAGQIADVTVQDYQNLFTCIWKELEYDYLVLELQPEMADVAELVKQCDEVYCFYKTEYAQEILFEQMNRDSMKDRIQRIKIPDSISVFCREAVQTDPLTQAEGMKDWMISAIGKGEF